MNEDGSLVLSSASGSTEYINTTYPTNEWFDLTIDVDLTSNIWSLFINNEARGVFENTVNQVASLDIFPLNGNQFYVDDVSVEYFPALLTSLDVPSYTQSPDDVEIAGTIFNYGTENINSFDVTWTNGTDSYTTNFANLNIAPQTTYNFICSDMLSLPVPSVQNLTVTVLNVNGTTDFDGINNVINHTIQSYEYVTQKIPLFEHFTSNTCGPCANFNPGFQVLLDNNDVNSINNAKANAIKYQTHYPGSGDQSFNNDVEQRHNYYGVTGVPRAHIDGSVTGSSQESIDSRSSIPCFLEIDATAVATNGLDLEVSVTINSYSDDYENAKLYIAVVENEYHNNLGSNGETVFHEVHRKMMPAGGTSIDLSNGSQVNVNESTSFEIGNVTSGSYNLWEGLNNCVVVLFIQNDITREVYQSQVVEITGNTIASVDEENSIFNLSPNPADQFIRLILNSLTSNSKIEIHSITGQKVIEKDIDNNLNFQNINLNISHLNSGVYTISLYNNSTKIVRKFIKK